MPVSIEELRPYLHAFDFTGLFVECLGWNHHRIEAAVIQIDDREFALKPVAQKEGFAVYECESCADSDIPEYPTRRRIESQVAKLAFEHLIVFVGPQRERQVWQWVRRESGKSAAYREQEYHAGQGGDPLLQRLSQISFSLDEEASLSVSTVTARVKNALDVEKVTRRFYDRFRKELSAFSTFIEGIAVEANRDWYASLMLNRMMFIYFIQKQGFLNRDTNYLHTKLLEVQEKQGRGRFQQFYYIFLRRLFHEGLGQPVSQRTPELDALLGNVPFLNGGLFDVHNLERDNPDISIPDEAFARVFDFFDAYRWHLDERPQRADNEINPDVLGYIFEKYVNQKQMGAYYTKEDITGYISRNTVIPFLFDAAKKECPVAFGPDGGVWRLLRDDPDRYIYPAVGHGITWNARDAEKPQPLDEPFSLPPEIEAGIANVSQRGGWNRPAPDDYALPTETWREVAARRQRYEEVRSKLAAGEVQEINDLITLNLDIELFARDVITQSEGPKLLRAFWHALRGVSVLDPTCGSGAFLFAALNILAPLYRDCLEGMQGFLDDLSHARERGNLHRRPNALSHFRDVLTQVGKHPNQEYYVLKSIVLNNLYGVDIMEEAVEICKLRLFLKLVAQLQSYEQIEPLPDIDFNIRAGNTLVGFTSLDAVQQAMTVTPDGQSRAMFDEDRATLARIQEEAEIASRAFDRFREQQTALGGEVTAADKTELRHRLQSLGAELDRYLATEYGVNVENSDAFDSWRAGHQPFHWFVEFYGTMNRGGFDVIIGNPPYVEYGKVKDDYSIKNYRTELCGNLYAFVLERCKTIADKRAVLSMIVPLSGHSTQRMKPLIKHFYEQFASCHLFNISADANPSVLFNGVKFRLSIIIASNCGRGTFTTGYCRWYAEQRNQLFDLISFTDIGDLRYESAIPKVSSRIHLQVLLMLLGSERRLRNALDTRGQSVQPILYHSAPVNWIRSHSVAPYFRSDRDGEKVPNGLNTLAPVPGVKRNIHAIISSTAFFVWWLSLSDCYHLNRPEVLTFPLCGDDLLISLSRELEEDMQTKSRRRIYQYKSTGAR